VTFLVTDFVHPHVIRSHSPRRESPLKNRTYTSSVEFVNPADRLESFLFAIDHEPGRPAFVE
jgi:hypothetical protein